MTSDVLVAALKAALVAEQAAGVALEEATKARVIASRVYEQTRNAVIDCRKNLEVDLTKP